MAEISTSLIHHPYVPPAGFEAPQPAVHKASTVIFPSVAAMRTAEWKDKTAYTYGLHGTPTTYLLEERLCTLEGGLQCLLLPSGLGAVALVSLSLLSAGEEVLIPDNAYSPNKALAAAELKQWGISHRFYDPLNPQDLADSIGPLTRLVWLEAPGSITLEFSRPIHNLSGADFVVFENSTLALYHYGGAGIGGIFGELAHVEVSADGEHFVRFPATALDGTAPGTYGSIDPTALHHLAGKHVNAYGECWGTPFDLAAVGLARATHLRIVDIPGDGSFRDAQGRPIRDPWPTFGSGGFDLDAVGVISTPLRYAEWPQLDSLDPAQRGPHDDPDHDGACNLLEFAQATLPWAADAAAPTIEVSDGHAQIRFRRDERMADLTLEVQASDTLAADSWVTLARATPGGPLQATGTPSPWIDETDLPGIAGVGVIRQCRVRDAHAISSSRTRYLRVKVTLHRTPVEP